MIKKLNINSLIQSKNIVKLTMDIKQSSSKIKRVKLIHIPVCQSIPPVERISVPSSYVEALNRSIIQKRDQSQRKIIVGTEEAKKLIVR